MRKNTGIFAHSLIKSLLPQTPTYKTKSETERKEIMEMSDDQIIAGILEDYTGIYETLLDRMQMTKTGGPSKSKDPFLSGVSWYQCDVIDHKSKQQDLLDELEILKQIPELRTIATNLKKGIHDYNMLQNKEVESTETKGQCLIM